MSEMVERVKSALLPLVNEDMEPAVRDAWLTNIALVAIETMREPTTVMRLCGGYIQKYGNASGDTYAYAIWQEMIDAALDLAD